MLVAPEPVVLESHLQRLLRSLTQLFPDDQVRIEFIQFKNFPPFADARIEFPESNESGIAEVQVITGQNGTGKTRLLCGLAAALGNTVDLDARSAPSEYNDIFVGVKHDEIEGLYVRSFKELLEIDTPNRRDNWTETIASGDAKKLNGIQSSEGKPRRLIRRSDEQVETKRRKEIEIGRRSVIRLGHEQVETASHDSLIEWALASSPAAVQAYRGTGRIADQKITAMQPVKTGERATHLLFERPGEDDLLVCQSMANLKMGAAMEYQSGAPRDECRSIKITERFESAIAKVTGRKFNFQVMPSPEVHLVARWGGAMMKLSVLPDGLRSIIAWLVACIAKLESQFPDHPDPLDIPLILLLDEPESHLHPAWQRQLIPAAQQLFPNAQIFVVTHSPFVISSVNSGWIHILRADETGTVKADPPIPCSKGDSYLDAVEDILGLTQWYDPETESLLSDFRLLRDEVIQGSQSAERLEQLASTIASRSDSLREMMGRELHPVRRNLARDTVKQ